MEREVKISVFTKPEGNERIVVFETGGVRIDSGDGTTIVLCPEESRILMEALQIVHGRLGDDDK